jgi:hypothetical protein
MEPAAEQHDTPQQDGGDENEALMEHEYVLVNDGEVAGPSEVLPSAPATATGSDASAEETASGLRASSRRRREPSKMADAVDEHEMLNFDAGDDQEESGRGTRTRGLSNPQGPGQVKHCPHHTDTNAALSRRVWRRPWHSSVAAPRFAGFAPASDSFLTAATAVSL